MHSLASSSGGRFPTPYLYHPHYVVATRHPIFGQFTGTSQGAPARPGPACGRSDESTRPHPPGVHRQAAQGRVKVKVLVRRQVWLRTRWYGGSIVSPARQRMWRTR